MLIEPAGGVVLLLYGKVGLVSNVTGLVELADYQVPAHLDDEGTAWAMAHATGDKAHE